MLPDRTTFSRISWFGHWPAAREIGERVWPAISSRPISMFPACPYAALDGPKYDASKRHDKPIFDIASIHP
ncbi:hypothetical protein PBS_30070 [Paraburkholderia sp. 2C]